MKLMAMSNAACALVDAEPLHDCLLCRELKEACDCEMALVRDAVAEWRK